MRNAKQGNDLNRIFFPWPPLINLIFFDDPPQKKTSQKQSKKNDQVKSTL